MEWLTAVASGRLSVVGRRSSRKAGPSARTEVLGRDDSFAGAEGLGMTILRELN